MLVITGDPIQDAYEVAQRKFQNYPGGALLTYMVANKLLDPYLQWGIVNTILLPQEPIGYNWFKNRQGIWKKAVSNLKPNYYSPVSLDQVKLSRFREFQIIISDYNKGSVNRPHEFADLLATEKIDWMIIDSRYRTVDKSWLDIECTKIWRCTGQEFDEEWFKHFDYLVWTNADDLIFVEDHHNNIESFSVPPLAIKNFIGAGDVFTAALGAKLMLKTRVDFETICQCIPFCIQASQHYLINERNFSLSL